MIAQAVREFGAQLRKPVHMIDYRHERRREERDRDRKHLAEGLRYARVLALGYLVCMGSIATVAQFVPTGFGVSLGVLLALALGLGVAVHKDFVWLAERFRRV